MKRRSVIVTTSLLAALCLPAVILLNGVRIEAAQDHPTVNTPAASVPEVAVIQVSRADYRAAVSGYGEAKPQYQLTLASDIGGRVVQLSDAFVSGQQVAAGTILARLDPASYQKTVNSARAALADAELALLEEQRLGEQALQEWQHSGLTGEPASPLVLRQPQLQAAEAAVADARSQLAAAQRDLDNTLIRAPFDALVVARTIQPGSIVQVGSEIGTLYSTAKLEIAIPLSAHQWQNLPDADSLQETPWPVQLQSSDGLQQWSAQVQRVTRHITGDTRQRALVAVVDAPLSLAEPLYPGTFVSARVAGRQVQGVWQVPQSAITQSGEVWLVDDQQQLLSVNANVVFSDGEYSYLEPLPGLSHARVVLLPLNSYLAGMRVQPQETNRS